MGDIKDRLLKERPLEADNMPKMQRRDREKYKNHTSDQCRPLGKFGNSMEMDKVHTYSMNRSGTLLVIRWETYAQKKTLKADHGHRRSYDNFPITYQKSFKDQKIIPIHTKKS